MASNNLDVSIVIVSFNTKSLVENCIQSIIEQSINIRYEIIVVDNASSDGTAELIQSLFVNITLIQNSVNKGFAAANNQGITIAKGEYVLLLNSDTIILNNALDKVHSFIEKHSEISIIGCRQLFESLKLQPSCRSFPTIWNILTEASFLYVVLNKTKLFGSYYMTYFKYDRILKVDVVMGSFMFIRKKVFEQIGLLDEKFFFYSEETDFCYRAAQKKYFTYFYPDAEIIHIGGGSTQNLPWMFEQLHKSQYQFINKHFLGYRRMSMIMGKKIGIAVRVPVYFVSGVITFNRLLIEKSSIYFRLFFMNISVGQN